jgi:hypothetical protein
MSYIKSNHIAKALRFHCQGRSLMFVATLGALWVALPHTRIAGWIIAGAAGTWAIIAWFTVCGLRVRKKHADDLSLSIWDHWSIYYVTTKSHSAYPLWTFIIDVIFLLLIVLHTGSAFSVFVPMFLVLGTLGDYALAFSKRRKLFIPVYILVPYFFVILVSTSSLRANLATFIPRTYIGRAVPPFYYFISDPFSLLSKTGLLIKWPISR